METSVVTTKGQVVIPSSVRKKYNMKAHSSLELLDRGGEIVLVPVPKDSFRAAKGILKGRISLSDLFEYRRHERQRERKK